MRKHFPQIVEVDDYHEFQNIQDHMRMVESGIKVKEIGCDGVYFGIAYIGKITDKANNQMIKELYKRQREFAL